MFMPNFFNHFPKSKNKKGTYKIKVYELPLFREDAVLTEKIVKGKLWKAYIKVRISAMLNDILTNGSSSGIAWSIENVNNPSESWGYKSNTDKK